MLSVVVDNLMEENDLSLQTDTVLVKVSDQIFYLFFLSVAVECQPSRSCTQLSVQPQW